MHKTVIVVLLFFICFAMANKTAATSINYRNNNSPANTADAQIIITSPISGTMSTCLGVASTTYQQFTFSGYNLPPTITIFPTRMFDVSLSSNSGYITGQDKSMVINTVNGKIENLTVYIRTSAETTSLDVTDGMTWGGILVTAQLSSDYGRATLIARATILSLPQVHVSDQIVCAGTATNNIAFTGTGNYYTWTNDHPEIGLAASGTGNITAFVAKNTNSAPLVATIKVTPVAQCTGTPVAFSITVNPAQPPAITAITQTNPICDGNPATFTATPTNPGVQPQYQWRVNGNEVGFNSNTYTASTIHDGDKVTCTLSSIRDCYTPVISNTVTMNVNPLPQVHFNNTIYTIYPGQSILLAPMINTTGNTYLWTPATGLSSPTALNTYAAPTKTTTYQLAVTSAANCINTASVTVVVNNVNNTDGGNPIVHNGYIFIPNTFTPNGDSINDYWDIPQLIYYPNCTVKVFNRYGSIIYQSTGYAKAWDGTIHSKPVPVGTFYYVIDLNRGDDPLRAGYVCLLRE